MDSSLMSSPESERMRSAFGQFVTGVCIVTAVGREHPIGMTVSSFNSVSLDPALILWSVGTHAPEYSDFCSASDYVVHILSTAQVDLSNRFATPGIDKFDGLAYTFSTQNIPLLPNVVARFHCAAVHNYPAGDHNILVGKVTGFDQLEGDNARLPLVYFASEYREIGAVAGH